MPSNKKHFRPNMPSKRSSDPVRVARFAQNPVETINEQIEGAGVFGEDSINSLEEPAIETIADLAKGPVESDSRSTTVIEPEISTGGTAKNETPSSNIPVSNIIRRPWREESSAKKKSKSYLRTAFDLFGAVTSTNGMLIILLLISVYWFFLRGRFFQKNNTSGNISVQEQTDGGAVTSEGPRSLKSSLRFKSPTMILGEIRKNPSIKVAPFVNKK